jgi:hypothetical protein
MLSISITLLCVVDDDLEIGIGADVSANDFWLCSPVPDTAARIGEMGGADARGGLSLSIAILVDSKWKSAQDDGSRNECENDRLSNRKDLSSELNNEWSAHRSGLLNTYKHSSLAAEGKVK